MVTEDQGFVVLGSSDVQDFNEKGVLPLPAEKFVKVQTWLAPTEYAASSSEYGKHCASHLAGTGAWISQIDQYQQWHNSDRGALWIKAIAGAGKSVIAASITSKLAAEEQVPVLYFFFRHIISANQKPQSLIRDYMSQLLEYSPELQHNLYKLIDDHRSLDSVSLDEMWKILVSALSRFPRVYCIADALDEMDTGNEFFLHNLVALAEKDPAAIKVLMTSRPVPQVERVLRHPCVLEITLEPQLIHPDISAYIIHRVNKFSVSEKIRSQIHKTMCARADGHFLYARLMMDELLEPSKNLLSREEDLFSALNKLPTPMADMYTQMLIDHSQRSGVPQNLQLPLLQWVTGAERPLRVLELSSMIDFKRPALDACKDTKLVVREGCGPLLEILTDETVCPIHHSFTEYLYDLGRLHESPETATFTVIDYKEAQCAIAITCIRYLASGWHHHWQTASQRSQSRNYGYKQGALKMMYPLLDYAANNWCKHVRKSGAKDGTIAAELDTFFLGEPKMLLSWLELTTATERRFSSTSQDPEVFKTWKALHAAAAEGLGFYVERLIEKGHDIECSDSEQHAPLALAASNGHDEVVAILLKHGAQNDKDDSFGLKPIHYAAKKNHHGVVKLLLESGVDPFTPKTKEYPGRRCGNAPSSVGETPVEYACQNGHVEAIKAFIPYLEDDKLYRALAWAIRFGHTSVAMVLLEVPGLDVNRVVGNQTLLYLASNGRHIELMRSLMRMGANAFALSSRSLRNRRSVSMADYPNKLSPLHGFAKHDVDSANHSDWDASLMNSGFEMLLDAGLDPNTVDAGGWTILHDVVRSNSCIFQQGTRHGIENTLSLLFNRGLSANSLARDGSNALHLASGVSIAVVDILTACGVDINQVRKSDGKTPLMAALERKDFAIVQHLLDRGADTNLADAEGNTPLHFLAKVHDYQLDLEMINTLIAAGADVNGRNNEGNTPMHLGEVNPKLLSMFLEHGFNIEAKNKKGHTVLFQWISRWRVGEHHKTLIEAGASPETRDFQGSTILHALLKDIRVSGAKTTDLLRYFVEKGVDPLSQDNSGNTLWHVAAGLGADYHQKEQLAAMNLLMEYGVSPTARNNAGQTPLHIAFSVKRNHYPYGAIEFLLEHTSANVNATDYDNIRPIHLTSSNDPELTCFLLELGADPTAVTVEGQTPLMVACRNRQCNIVCILLDHYKDYNRLALVDRVDYRGRSALHYACKSGRPETVAMLLDAGATINIKDKEGYTPFHLCAEYLDEQASWDRAEVISRTNGQNKAAYVLSTDLLRPHSNNGRQDPIRIRETIRLLVASGVDTSFLTSNSEFSDLFCYSINSRPNPLLYAISKGCEAMISELLIMQDKLLQAKVPSAEHTVTGPGDLSNEVNQDFETVDKRRAGILGSYSNRVRLLRMRHMPEIIAENVKPGDNNVWLIQQLLKEDDEPSVEETARLGACFLELDNGGDNPLIHMASWGFTDLMRRVGQDAAQMNPAWTRGKAALNFNWREERLKGILQTALTRQIPNLGMVKLFVSEFKLDPNDMFSEGGYKAVTSSFVHLIARPNHWWQTKALEFLIENGANIEALNSNQETPLIVALREPYGNVYSPARVRAVETLLRHGANPNAVDKSGLTCLNIAAGQPRCVKMLLKYGANPSLGFRPFIFDAIQQQDIESVQIIVDSGKDVNILTQPEPELKEDELDEDELLDREFFGEDDRKGGPQNWSDINDVSTLSKRAYPIHVAASRFFTDTPERKEKTIRIINLLLRAGADPSLFYEDGSSIMHLLAEQYGIIEPFFAHPSFDTESRDHQGRTLLLAASHRKVHKIPSGDTTLISLLIQRGASLTAVDRDGCNALHFLLPALSLETLLSVAQPFLPILAAKPNLQGRTPFHYAVSASRFDLIDILISHGADPLIPDPLDGSTALHHLATGLAEPRDILIHDPRAAMTPEDISRISAESNSDPLSNDALQHYVRTKMFSSDKLAHAEQHSPRRHIASLLAHGLSIDARDHAGEPPLFKLMTINAFTASLHRHTLFPALKVFEDAGANFEARNKIGESVLHKLATQAVSKQPFRVSQDAATDEDFQKTFKWLVEKGVSVSWEDEANRTCLDVAAATGAQWALDMYKRK